MPRFREEVINVVLAELICGYGLEADPETISRKGRPDVAINMGGLRVVIEGRFDTFAALKPDVVDRITTGLADISIGVCYPPTIRRSEGFPKLKSTIKTSNYSGGICQLSRTGLATVPFENLGLKELVELINQVFHVLIEN